MGGTTYFEEEVPVAGKTTGTVDSSVPPTTISLMVSSYSGTHQIYLRLTDEEGEYVTYLLNKEHAVALHEGIEKAAFYLQYIK